jgi:tRNA (guanine26-N2/guanine27-N2)-dimethyltransferase
MALRIVLRMISEIANR